MFTCDCVNICASVPIPNHGASPRGAPGGRNPTHFQLCPPPPPPIFQAVLNIFQKSLSHCIYLPSNSIVSLPLNLTWWRPCFLNYPLKLSSPERGACRARAGQQEEEGGDQALPGGACGTSRNPPAGRSPPRPRSRLQCNHLINQYCQ